MKHIMKYLRRNTIGDDHVSKFGQYYGCYVKARIQLPRNLSNVEKPQEVWKKFAKIIINNLSQKNHGKSGQDKRSERLKAVG